MPMRKLGLNRSSLLCHQQVFERSNMLPWPFASHSFLVPLPHITFGPAQSPRGPAKITQISRWDKPMNEAILSPDGRAVAFTSPVSGFDQVFVMLASGGDPLQLTNDSVDKAVDSFSLDGTQIFYEAVDEVRAVAALGGPSTRLVAGSRLVPSPTDDYFFFLNPSGDGVYRKPKTGLGEELIFGAAKEGMLVSRILPYPNGKELLVAAGKASEFTPSTLTLFKVNAITHNAQRAGELTGNPTGLVWA